MTEKKKRRLILVAIICLIGLGILGYRILHTPGEQLAYATIKGRACLVSGLRTRCEHYLSFYDSNLPPLSPDSTFLDLYERTWPIEIDGEESILLAEIVYICDSSPRWSPDQHTIAYTSSDSARTGICLADTEGGYEQCYQMEEKLSCVRDFSWSPDGKQLAFSALLWDWTACPGDAKHWAALIFDLDTSSYTVFVEEAFDLSWSPDGQQIAFASNRDGNSEIYTIDVDGSDLRRITNHPAEDYDPAWSPDGDRIAFVSDRGPGSVSVNLFDSYSKKRIYIVNAKGGRAWMFISRPFDSIERFVWGE